MLFNVINYSGVIIGQVEAIGSLEAWSNARKIYTDILDVRICEPEKITHIRKVGEYKVFYHTTRTEKIPDILLEGLLPSTGVEYVGLGFIHRPGVYLADSIEALNWLMDKYEYRSDRVAGSFALLKVTLPMDWPLTIDREIRVGSHYPARISYQPIPPQMLQVIDEYYYTISQYGNKIRELPGRYVSFFPIGTRVRVKSTGKEGVVRSFSGYSEVWVLIDGEVYSSELNEEDLALLIP